MGNRRGVTPLQEFVREKASIRNSYITTAIGELLGTFIVMLFAVGAGCQARLMAGLYEPFGSWFMGLSGGVIGLIVAVVTVGGLSGAHVNPAFTLAAAIAGVTSWAKLPVYWCSQFIGAYIGSGVAYALYMGSLIPGGSRCDLDMSLPDCQAIAGVFAPLPRSSMGIAFADQVIGTGLLLMFVLGAIDPRNMKVPTYFYGPLFAVGLFGVNCAFGINAGGVLNPARDISARLMAITVGFDPRFVFLSAPRTLEEEHYWVAPLFGPLVGGIVAALIYNFAVGAHLRDPAPEPTDPYIPNRFNLQRVHSHHDTHSQSQYTTAPPSQKSYAPPLHSQTLPYRSGGYV